MDNPPARKNPPPPVAVTAAQAGRISSAELFGARRELVIEHDGREYRLRLTQNGKLILTA